MGFLSSVTGGAIPDRQLDTGGGLAGSAIGGIWGGALGLMGENGHGGGYENPEEMNRYNELRKKQADEAKKFRSEIPTYLSQLGENQDQEIRGKMYQDLYSNKVSANRRGLLGSGIQRFGDLNTQAGAASESAQKRSQLERDLNQQANAYDSAVIEAGQAKYRGDIGGAESAYNEALNRRKTENASVAGLLGSVGQIGGSYLGGRK